MAPPPKPPDHPGKGHGVQNATLTPVLVTDVGGDGVISAGDTMTYEIETTDIWNQIQTLVYQHGVLVLSALQLEANYVPIQLVSQLYTGGAAHAVGTIQQFSGKQIIDLGTVEFDIAA